MLRTRFLPFSFFITLLFSFSYAQSQENADRTQEAKIKTIYMLNFAKYTMWPAEAMTDKFYIGVFNDAALVSAFSESVENKKVKDLPIEVISLDDVGNIGDFQMIYLGEEMNEMANEVRQQIGDRPILFLTAKEETGAGNINFLEENDHLKYELHKGHFERSGLKYSDSLENLAKKVTD